MCKWTNAQMYKMNKCINAQMKKWRNKEMKKCTNEQMNKWINE